ncbi:MAG: hypothetical protein Sapg2KO_02720 [Saprospiraceae bacterium]
MFCLCWGYTQAQDNDTSKSTLTDQHSLDLKKAQNLKDSFQIYMKPEAYLANSSFKDSIVLDSYLQGLTLAKKNKSPRYITSAYSKIFQFHFQKGQNDLVAECLEKGVVDLKEYEAEFPNGLGAIYRILHYFAYYNADYRKMLDYGELALSYLLKTDDYKLISYAYLDIGNAHYYLGDYQKALSNYISSAKLYETGKNNNYQVYGNIADVYLILNQVDKAEEVLQLFLTATNNDQPSKEKNQKVTIIHYKLSKVALINEDFETALDYALQSIEKNTDQLKSELIFANTYASTALSNLNRFPEALEYASRAFQMLKESPDIGLEAELENSTGNLYLNIGEEVEAQKHFTKSLKIAEEKGFVHLEMRSVFELSKLQKKNGAYEDALKNLDRYITLKDSIFTVENNQNISELQTKYDTEKKELENLNLKMTNDLIQAQNKKYLVGGLVLTGVVLLLGFFFIQLQRVKNQLAVQNKLVAEKNNKLTELDKVKSNFFANVSHELRTPLTLILGPISRLLKSNNISNKEFTMLKLMEQNGGSLLKLINEILDLSKLEANKLELKERPTVLYLFIQRLLASFESFAQKKSIDLIFEYQADPSLQINVDPNKLEKIINNLISNACKFTPPGGKITLEVQDQGHSLQFKISDTGRGIHQEDLPHIFNRFYQSKQADTRAEGGTGIGLALAHQFAVLFGGSIEVESELNKGSIFTLQFPKKEVLKALENEDASAIVDFKKNQPTEGINNKVLAAQMVLAKQTIQETLPKNKKIKILVVEDNLHLREYVQLVLDEFYQVQTAENGQEALNWLNDQEVSNYPNLIISDVMMPIMDGMEFLSNLKQGDKFNGIPVVMLTAKASLEDRLAALRIGVDDYMIKPFIEEELLARVENLLKNALARKQYLIDVVNEQDLEIKENPLENEALEKNDLLSPQNLEWLADLEQKVLEAYTDFDFTLERLSEMIFLSPRQIRRRLKELTGLSFSHYLREVRLSEARRMLENKEVSTIKQLAYEVGLRDVKYFSQQFKTRFGKSPSEYFDH